MENITLSGNILSEIEKAYDNNNANQVKSGSTILQAQLEYLQKRIGESYIKKELPEVYNSFKKGYYHLNDFAFFWLKPHNCWTLNPISIFESGLITNGDKTTGVISKPAKYLTVALNHLIEAEIMCSNEMSGGINIPFFNWALAPYWSFASKTEKRQAIQNYVYRLNQITASRGAQTMFSSINLNLDCPEFLKQKKVPTSIENKFDPIRGTKYFGDFQNEADEIVKYICKIMNEGDARGAPMLFPNIVFNITNSDLTKYPEIFDLTTHYWLPYFTVDKKDIYSVTMGPVAPKTEITIKKENNSIEILSIEDLYKKYKNNLKNIKTLAISENDNIIWHKINNIIKNSKAKLKQYNLTNNRYLMAEPSHEVFDMNGNKHQIDNMNYIKDINYFEITNNLKPSLEGILMGFCLGDGTPVIERNGTKYVYIQLYKQDKINFLTNILSKTDINYKINKKQRKPRKKDNIYEYTEFLIYDNNLFNNCKEPNWNNIEADNLNLLSGILSGLISSDGHVADKKRAITTEFNNKNYKINQLFSYCCFRLGLKTTRGKNRIKHKSFKTYINCNYDNINILKQLILREKQFTILNNCNNNYKKVNNIQKRTIKEKHNIENDYTYCLDVNGSMIVGDDRILISNCRTRMESTYTKNEESDCLNVGNAVYSCLNLPYIALKSIEDNMSFFDLLKKCMFELRTYTLLRKERIISCLDNGMMNFLKQYYDINNMSLAIGMLGLNECLEILYDKPLDEIPEKGEEILQYMTNIIDKFKKDGLRWGLFSNPSENTAFSLAKKTISEFGIKKAKTRGTIEAPYYTNGINIDSGKDINIIKRIKIEGKLTKYTPFGNICNINMGEAYTDPEALCSLTEKIRDNSENFFWAYSGAYSICNKCDQKFNSTLEKCPLCDSLVTTYDRVTGYYRPTKSYNKGKAEEQKNRFRY